MNSQTRGDEVYTTFRGKMSLQITTKTFQTLWEVFSFFLKLIYVLCQCKKHQCSCCSVCSQNNAYGFFFFFMSLGCNFFRSVGYVSRDVLRSQVFEQWFSALCVWRRFRDHRKTADANFQGSYGRVGGKDTEPRVAPEMHPSAFVCVNVKERKKVCV